MDGATTEVPGASELRALMVARESDGTPFAALDSPVPPGEPCEIAEGEAVEKDEDALARGAADRPAGASA
jgi:hypothetical protein